MMRIVLDKPARRWDDGLPVGNGRLGAMVLGKINEETLHINEETLWYGPDRDRKNPDALAHLADIRELLNKGETEEAQFLAKMALTSMPKYVNPYQPAGDLRICFLKHSGKVSGYLRQLDLEEAVACVSYEMDGVSYKREILASFNYQVLAVKLTSNEKNKLNLSINISRKPFEEHTGKIDCRTTGNWGRCGAEGVQYFLGARLDSPDGKVSAIGDFIYVRNASVVYIYIAAATDFMGRTDYKESVLEALDRAQEASYEKIRTEHVVHYRSLYDRISLSVNDTEKDSRFTSLPANQLLAELRQGRTEFRDYLALLLFNYGRYLMISSSYGCLLPANLQGIWNGSFEPPWQSEFTININTEMNYWMAEKCGLPECHMPLFHLLDRMVEKGKATATRLYGCEGFCAHHNTNLWANTDPEGIFDASPIWPMGGAWLSLHLYEHYLYTLDRQFLRSRALPVMREAIRFFRDYLCENNDGLLVTGPSLSPENTYISKTGARGSLCMGPSMDIQILRQLFSWYIEGCGLAGNEDGTVEGCTMADTGDINEECVMAGFEDGTERCALAGTEDEILAVARSMLLKLPETKITSDGRIMEWQEEYDEPEPGHRHISHLYGLHPGNEIVENKPLLFHAAEKTLEHRLAHGGGHTGWSRAWITCFYARLKKGREVLESMEALFKHSIQDNLLDTHPPFQIDGNFGFVEAVLESLIQSHNSYIEVLPALPPAWRKGKLAGVRLRGGLTADLSWNEGILESFALVSAAAQTVEIRYGEKRRSVLLKKHTKNFIVFT